MRKWPQALATERAPPPSRRSCTIAPIQPTSGTPHRLSLYRWDGRRMPLIADFLDNPVLPSPSFAAPLSLLVIRTSHKKEVPCVKPQGLGMAASFFDDNDEVNLTGGRTTSGKSKEPRSDKSTKQKRNVNGATAGGPSALSMPQGTVAATPEMRFCITAQDALVAEKHRRLASSSSGTSAGLGHSTHIQDALIASMEAAQRKREAEREMALVAKLRAEREADSHVPELVDKDLEVGVFVTDAYRKKLRATVATINGEVLEDDDAPPSSGRLDSAVSSIGQGRAKYYDTVMSMDVSTPSSEVSDNAVATGAPTGGSGGSIGSGGDGRIGDPLPAAGATPGTADDAKLQERVDRRSGGESDNALISVQQAKDEALRRLEAAKRAARRARSAFVVDEQMLAAARQRFVARQAATLEQHATFLR